MTDPSAVRPATGGDVAAIVELEAAAFPTDGWSAALVTEGVGDRVPTVTYLVAERHGGLAGYAVVSVVDVDAELQRIAVRPGLRRAGVATDLLAAARRLAAGEGAERLLLEVREDNRAALAFYARHGFAELGRRPRYYRDGTTALVLSTPVTMDA
ncbi:ribosomal protein S18-alanine N-acetyltransferase [Nocardioides sp. SYSU DS0651]|uniref:ribosomal protein S18-alanine N-acetyltransferase n=1 Tax=Nocardioides sp. SYSU DS0651 TaxID=3415955 RepID=UPI003F4BA74A